MGILDLTRAIAVEYGQSNLERPSSAALQSLHDEFPGLPSEYFTLLEKLGWGEIGDTCFMLYSGPMPAEEIFSDEPALKGALLIGDDFAGYHLGYRHDETGWHVIQFEHTFPAAFQTNEALADALASILGLPE
jgi:hypothetical protein